MDRTDTTEKDLIDSSDIMPRPRKSDEQQQVNDPAEDECDLMYPVFCTARIPPAILDEFLDETHNGCVDLVGGNGDVGGSPCILTTKDLDSIVRCSRKPMKEFESPFLNWTDSEIRAWMRRYVHEPKFAEMTFAIFDEDTIKNKTCRIGYASKYFHDNQTLLTDFYANMWSRVPIEMATMSWSEEDLVGTGLVYNRKAIEAERAGHIIVTRDDWERAQEREGE